MKNRMLRCVASAATGVMAALAIGALAGTAIELTAQEPEHGAPAAAPDAKQIVVDNFSFTPASAAVAVGTTVTWTNHDDIPHNVVSPEQKFKSPVLDTDQMFSHKFEAAGTYKYYCSIHPRMTGQVVVR